MWPLSSRTSLTSFWIMAIFAINVVVTTAALETDEDLSAIPQAKKFFWELLERARNITMGRSSSRWPPTYDYGHSCYAALHGKTPEPCIFPFTYHGVKYEGCTTIDDSKPWCATAVDDNGNYMPGKYGYCSVHCNLTLPDCITNDGPVQQAFCTFPFTFKDITFYSCTHLFEEDTNRTWCATETDSHGFMLKDRWGYCYCLNVCNLGIGGGGGGSGISAPSTSESSILVFGGRSGDDTPDNTPVAESNMEIISVSEGGSTVEFQCAKDIPTNPSPRHTLATYVDGKTILCLNRGSKCFSMAADGTFTDLGVDAFDFDLRFPDYTALTLDGKWYIISDRDTTNTALYDPVANSFSLGIQMPQDTWMQCAVKISETKALIVGGQLAGEFAEELVQATAWIYENGVFRRVADYMHGPVRRAVCGLVDGGAAVVVAGGQNQAQGLLEKAAKFDIATETWCDYPPLPQPVLDAQPAQFSDAFLTVGGFTKDEINSKFPLTEIYKYDPDMGGWSLAGNLDTSRKSFAIAVVPNSDVPAC